MVEQVVSQLSIEAASEQAAEQAVANAQIVNVEQRIENVNVPVGSEIGESSTVVLPVTAVVGESSSTPDNEDGFQVVTRHKNRVRAPDPASVAKSPWNLFSGQKKVQLDDKAFPSLGKPVWKMSAEPPQPAKGKGRGKKKK
ncbi:unnamed protein product [Linum trigynum]|uniref:Uncharacterized protein n=1 Tax=Linum trigynum TaxID=586398 RepID=A0AAV2EXE7_9ROSI